MPQMEEIMQQQCADSPLTSTQAIAAELSVCHSSVKKSVIHSKKMYLFHTQRVQLLTKDYYSCHLQFVHSMIDITTQSLENPHASVLGKP